MSYLIAFMENSEADTMYYHQAMIQLDRNQFRESMVKEFNNHTKRKHCKVVPMNDVTTVTRILYSIWSIK